MKKLFLLILSVLLLGLIAIYILIPSTLTITETASLPCVADAGLRILTNENTWEKWWPGKIERPAGQAASYQLPSGVYKLSQKMMNTFAIVIQRDGDSINSHITLLNLPHDSSIIKWECSIQAGSSPFQRLKSYREAVALKKDMQTVLLAAQHYLSGFENVYGSLFKESSTSDTALVTTSAFSPVYPSTAFIYSLTDKLKLFCNTGQCKITGIPMLNVTPLDTAGFKVMVALPVDHTVPDKGDIRSQKMIPGKFIVTEITGGPHRIEQAHQQLKYYFQDYHRTSMAIPFEYLVTDRLKETDTAKWHTRVYAPVY
jgi:hypothetical protein